MDNKSLLYEKARILMAYELRIAPDDIDLSPILESIFRAIRESCENRVDEIILTIKNEKEEKAILSDYGQMIVKRVFENQYPFDGIVDQYQQWYVSKVLDKIDEGE